MAVIINAVTSGPGGIQMGGDASGTLQLQSAGNTIMTISSTGVSTQVGSPAVLAWVNGKPSRSTSCGSRSGS